MQGYHVVVIIIVVSTKIAISQDLGTIEFGEKLTSVCVKSRNAVLSM